MAVADKWSDLKTQTYLDKKKRHRNLEEAKMDSSGTQKKKKAVYEKSLEKKKKYESMTENYLKDERFSFFFFIFSFFSEYSTIWSREACPAC